MRIAVISLVLDEPDKVQKQVNEVVSNYKNIIRGRMGLPLVDQGVSIISIVVIATADTINAFTGKLGKIEHVQVQTSFSKKEI